MLSGQPPASVTRTREPLVVSEAGVLEIQMSTPSARMTEPSAPSAATPMSSSAWLNASLSGVDQANPADAPPGPLPEALPVLVRPEGEWALIQANVAAIDSGTVHNRMTSMRWSELGVPMI